MCGGTEQDICSSTIYKQEVIHRRMARTVTKNACAKINLGLDVVGVREDGYHLLRMIMRQIDLYDTLTFTVRKPGEETGASVANAGKKDSGTARISAGTCRDGLTSRGSILLTDESGQSPAGADNLICRAIKSMMERYDLRADVDVELIKRIPVAAGLAGGSTDAAAAFCALRDLLVPDASDKELMELAVELGADIPYCIAGGTKLAEGIGEILTDLPQMPECAIILVKPEASASTQHVYRALDALEGYHHPDIDGQIDALQRGDLAGLCARCENVLELITGESLPIIKEVEDFFIEHGAIAARMSGSGPSVFAVFETSQEAETARGAFLRTEMAAECRTFLCRPFH